MNKPHSDETQTAISMNESERMQERDGWASDHYGAIHLRDLPFEAPPYRSGSEETLSIAAVLYALSEIRKGKCRKLKSGVSDGPIEKIFGADAWEEVDSPPEAAVRIITRALQAGAEGEKLIVKALKLGPREKGTILARNIAKELTKPKGGWPKRGPINHETVEWVKPCKQEVERELEKRYPEIYDRIPKKDGGGGKILRSDFWRDAGLKDAINQARGNC